MSSVNPKKIYVATYKEIIIGFVVFCIILIILYPKDVLTKQILAEQSNYDLSMLYLQNMLKNDPSNELLMLNLAKQAYKSRKRDLSFRLLHLLNNSKDSNIRSKSYKLSYEIAKEDYYYFKKHKKSKEQNVKLHEMQLIYNTILDEHLYAEDDIAMLYQESYFLDDKIHRYFLLQQLLKKNPNDIKMLTNAYYLASDLKEYNKAMTYLERLSMLDSAHQHKWFEQKYFLLANQYRYDKAESYLISHAQHSQFWTDKLLRFYLDHKKYKKASAMYMNAFHKASSLSEQRELWLKAINTLRAGNLNRNALQLAYKYENYFLRDEKARVELLKLYMALNDLQKAHSLSKKILRIKR